MKQSGLGDYIAVDNSAGSLKDISNDVNSVQVSTPQGLIEVTGLDKSAMERIVGMCDGQVQLSGTFNPASNLSHDVFKVRTAVRTVTYCIGGNTSTYPKLSMEMVIANYELNRATDGSVRWTATLQLADGTVPTWTTV